MECLACKNKIDQKDAFCGFCGKKNETNPHQTIRPSRQDNPSCRVRCIRCGREVDRLYKKERCDCQGGIPEVAPDSMHSYHSSFTPSKQKNDLSEGEIEHLKNAIHRVRCPEKHSPMTLLVKILIGIGILFLIASIYRMGGKSATPWTAEEKKRSTEGCIKWGGIVVKDGNGEYSDCYIKGVD